MMREGIYPGVRFPLTPGYDVVGTVAALGADVSGISIGDEVASLTVNGGYSAYVTAPAKHVAAISAGARCVRSRESRAQLRHGVPDARHRKPARERYHSRPRCRGRRRDGAAAARAAALAAYDRHSFETQTRTRTRTRRGADRLRERRRRRSDPRDRRRRRRTRRVRCGRRRPLGAIVCGAASFGHGRRLRRLERALRRPARPHARRRVSSRGRRATRRRRCSTIRRPSPAIRSPQCAMRGPSDSRQTSPRSARSLPRGKSPPSSRKRCRSPRRRERTSSWATAKSKANSSFFPSAFRTALKESSSCRIQ